MEGGENINTSIGTMPIINILQAQSGKSQDQTPIQDTSAFVGLNFGDILANLLGSKAEPGKQDNQNIDSQVEMSILAALQTIPPQTLQMLIENPKGLKLEQFADIISSLADKGNPTIASTVVQPTTKALLDTVQNLIESTKTGSEGSQKVNLISSDTTDTSFKATMAKLVNLVNDNKDNKDLKDVVEKLQQAFEPVITQVKEHVAKYLVNGQFTPPSSPITMTNAQNTANKQNVAVNASPTPVTVTVKASPAPTTVNAISTPTTVKNSKGAGPQQRISLPVMHHWLHFSNEEKVAQISQVIHGGQSSGQGLDNPSKNEENFTQVLQGVSNEPIKVTMSDATVDTKATVYQHVSPKDISKVASDMLVKYMKLGSTNGISEARITLTPDNLGTVDVKITVQNGSVTASFAAHTTAGKDALESQMNQLRLSLHNIGLQVDKIDVVQNASQFDKPLPQYNQQSAGQQSRQQRERSQTDENIDAESIGGESFETKLVRSIYLNSFSATV